MSPVSPHKCSRMDSLLCVFSLIQAKRREGETENKELCHRVHVRKSGTLLSLVFPDLMIEMCILNVPQMVRQWVPLPRSLLLSMCVSLRHPSGIQAPSQSYPWGTTLGITEDSSVRSTSKETASSGLGWAEERILGLRKWQLPDWPG